MKNKNEIIYDRDLSNPEKKMRKKRKRPANSKENSVNNSFNNDEERGTQKKDTVITLLKIMKQWRRPIFLIPSILRRS